MPLPFIIIAQPFIYVGMFLAFMLLVFPISVVALPFSLHRRLKMTAWFWRAFFDFSLKYIVGAKVIKIDERDESQRDQLLPVGLYIANHQSFADIPLVFSTFIIPPIMKKSLLYIPFFGICCYSSGAILVDRKNTRSRKKVFQIATRRLTHGFKQLQYYPEGTRSRSRKPKEFSGIKPALIKFAFDKNIPVYPISISGTHEMVKSKLILPGTTLKIKFHAPVKPENFSDKEQFAKSCWKQVTDGFEELTKINN